MKKEITPKISVISSPGAIFASAFTSDDIKINNYQVLSFLIISGAGEAAANTTVTVQAKTGETGTAENVNFLIKEVDSASAPTLQKTKQVSVGGATSGKSYIVSITADMLAGTGYDTVILKTSAIASNETVGSIVALQEQPRYSR